MSVYRYILQSLTKHSARVMFTFQGRSYKYGDMMRWASAIRQDMKPVVSNIENPRIGIRYHNHPAVFAGIMAAWSFGATVVMFPPYIHHKEKEHMYGITRPHLVLAEPRDVAHNDDFSRDTAYKTDLPDACSPDQDALILFSSGTSACNRKVIVLTHSVWNQMM